MRQMIFTNWQHRRFKKRKIMAKKFGLECLFQRLKSVFVKNGPSLCRTLFKKNIIEKNPLNLAGQLLEYDFFSNQTKYAYTYLSRCTVYKVLLYYSSSLSVSINVFPAQKSIIFWENANDSYLLSSSCGLP